MSDLMSTNGIRVYSEEDMKQYAPSIFASRKSPKRTSKYSFLPTHRILDVIEEKGWKPYSVRQQGTGKYARHMIRLENSKFGPVSVDGDTIKPQLLVDNSHNGLSSARVHVGLFRLVCSNGLVVGMPGLSTSFKFKHMGLNRKEIYRTIEEASEQFSTVVNHVDDMRNVNLTKVEKEEFAIKAISLRHPDKFIDEDGTIKTDNLLSTVNIEDIYTPIRRVDKSNDLWTTFNVIQEKVINGNFDMFGDNNKIRKARPITYIERNLTYNRQLWELAENYI